MNISNKGIITLSFDCEAKWGMADRDPKWLFKLTNDDVMDSYRYIFEQLEKCNIPATFAFVGAMTESKDEFIDKYAPSLTGSNHTKWLQPIISKVDEEGWFFPEILDFFNEFQDHEIASHGYTHIPFNRMTDDEVRQELNHVENWSSRKGIECKTFIYPRNIVSHTHLLSDYGLDLYRDIPKDFHNNFIPSSLNRLIEEVNIFKNSERPNISAGYLPGGNFINWQYGFRRYVPRKFSLLKYKHVIDHAIKNNNVAHFWVHPHNFISAPKTKYLFEDLCIHIKEGLHTGSLEVFRQKDFIYK